MRTSPFELDCRDDVLVVVPGSFNPLHDGHVALSDAASELVRRCHPSSNVVTLLEISITNVDKPKLTYTDVLERVSAIVASGRSVALTKAPLFSRKTSVLHDASYFVVGADTATRLVDPKYYGGDENRMNDELREMGKRVKFVVGGRWVFFFAGRARARYSLLQHGERRMERAERAGQHVSRESPRVVRSARRIPRRFIVDGDTEATTT